MLDHVYDKIIEYKLLKLVNFLIKKLNSQLVIFITIVFLASIFRLTNLDLIEFKTDEAVNLFLAARPIFGHGFAPGGTVSSIGILNPPFFTYLLFPLTIVSLDPRFSSFAIGLINSIAIGFLFLVIKKYYNQRIALISTILMAFSPWAIIYSRKIWTQDLLIPFFVPFFYCFHKLLNEQKQIFWIPYGVFSLFLIQLHQVSIVFVSILTILLILQKNKINLKYISIGILIGILPLIPYLLFQAKNNCPDCHAFTAAGNRLSSRSLNIFIRPLQIVSQGDFRFIMGDDTLSFSQNFPLVDKLRKIFYIEYLLIPLGFFIFLKKYKKLRLIAYSIALLPIIYYLLKIESFMHYYIIILPLLFLFLATSLDYFLANRHKLLKFTGFVILLSLIIESIAFNFSFFELINKQGSLKGDYGSTYRNSNQENENNLATFKNSSDYQEIKLSNYIPYSELLGYLPIPKMIFNYNDKDKRIAHLENLWKQNNKDPRIGQELLALNTIEPLTKKKVDELWTKQQNISGYKRIYELVKNTYLGDNYKANYYSGTFAFSLDYPSYWTLKDSKDQINLYFDKYIISIEELNNYHGLDNNLKKVNLLNQGINKIECKNKENWCGTSYLPIKVGNNYYILKFSGEENKSYSPQTANKAIEEVINSIRPY